MSKELQRFKRIALHTNYDTVMLDNYGYQKFEEDCKIVEQALKRLEQIDNANPSRALECLEALGGVEISHTETEQDEDFNGDWVFDTVTVDDGAIEYLYCEYFDTIKNYILKTQEQEKALKIVFEKNIDIDFLKSADTFEEYNKLIKFKSVFATELTQEEFDLLKRYTNE